jgi:PAS domain S-box-containing protein
MTTNLDSAALIPLFHAEDSGALLAGILTSAMDAIVTVNDNQQVLLYNQAAEKIFGWPVAQVIGHGLGMLMPERFRDGHGGHMRQFAQTGTTSRRMGDDTVLYGQRANGEEFPLEASISKLDSPQGKLFTVILRDVSERIRAREVLDAFATQAHAIRESEKTRIARELHDELAQSLTALKMDATWVRDNLTESTPSLRAKVNDMMTLLDEAVTATRRIAADLRPLLLDDLGLIPAIEWLVDNFKQRTGLRCTLLANQHLELKEPYATAVFRIVQESLVNVAKHAKASRVEVKIDQFGDTVQLSVQDDGQGFSITAPRNPQSLGLMGLRERALLLKGNIDIVSQPGAGTRIEVHLPVPTD